MTGSRLELPACAAVVHIDVTFVCNLSREHHVKTVVRVRTRVRVRVRIRVRAPHVTERLRRVATSQTYAKLNPTTHELSAHQEGHVHVNRRVRVVLIKDCVSRLVL